MEILGVWPYTIHGDLGHQLICILWTRSSLVQYVPLPFYNGWILACLTLYLGWSDRTQVTIGSLACAQLISTPYLDGLSLPGPNNKSRDIFQMMYDTLLQVVGLAPEH